MERLDIQAVVQFFQTSGYTPDSHLVIDFIGKRACIMGAMYLLRAKAHLLAVQDKSRFSAGHVKLSDAHNQSGKLLGNTNGYWYGAGAGFGCDRDIPAEERKQEVKDHIRMAAKNPKGEKVLAVFADIDGGGFEDGYADGKAAAAALRAAGIEFK